MKVSVPSYKTYHSQRWLQLGPDRFLRLQLCCRPRDYGERDPEASAAGQQGLAGLFEPPHDILFKGSFEEAKEAAQGQERWLVILSIAMALTDSWYLS